MSDFDDAYSSVTNLFYGENPSIHLEIFTRTEKISSGEALDLGCGDGRNSIYLAKIGFVVTGLDTAATGIEKLTKKATQENLRINSLVADVRTFHYEPNKYDLVVANTLLDHLEPTEGDILIETIKQTIKPSGFLYATVFTKEDPGFRKAGEQQSNTAQFVKRYFSPGELRQKFSELTLLRYHEEIFLDTKHGPPHYHAMARLMAKKNP